MKKFTLIIAMLVILAACGPAPTPSATPDLNATMSALSGTMVAGTLTAQPTNTRPPTETATPLPTETATMLPPMDTPDPSLPTATLDPSLPVATLDTSIPGAPTPTSFTGAFVPGDLTGLETALLRVENLSGVKEIVVTLTGVTKLRQVPVYLSYKVTGALNITIYEGSWQFKVNIPGKTFMLGGFRQTNKDKTTMKVYRQKVVILGP